MAKGKKMDDRVRGVIASVYFKHPKWRAAKIQNEVQCILNSGKWPGLSAVQKVIADMRKYIRVNTDIEDLPWSMSTLEQFEIPPDTILSVLKAFIYIQVRRNKPFTIREAKWVARLSKLTDDIEKLSTWAIQYAGTERAYKSIRDISLPSSEDDIIMYMSLTGETVSEETRRLILSHQGIEPWDESTKRFLTKLYDLPELARDGEEQE